MAEGSTIRNVSGSYQTVVGAVGGKNFTINRELLDFLLPQSDFDAFTQVSADDMATSFHITATNCFCGF